MKGTDSLYAQGKRHYGQERVATMGTLSLLSEKILKLQRSLCKLEYAEPNCCSKMMLASKRFKHSEVGGGGTTIREGAK